MGSDRNCKEAADTGFNYLKVNARKISRNISTTIQNYIVNYQDLHQIGITRHLALATLIAISPIALKRPLSNSLVALGDSVLVELR